jgi:hypothetical protein
MACMRLYREKLYPPETDKFCDANCKDFFGFMTERQEIWHRRFIEKKPRELWTANEVLKKTKYTNVYRQLDRGSLWSIQYVMGAVKRENFKTHFEYFRTLLFNITMYKVCNRIESFEVTGIPADIENFNFLRFHKRIMNYNKHSPVTTSAHLTCPTPFGLSKAEGFLMSVASLMVNIDNTTKKCLDLFEEYENKKAGLSEEEDKVFRTECGAKLFNIVKENRCVGVFVAYEIYCDLCYTGAIPFNTNDFVNIGPGAIEGTRMIYPSAKTKAEKLDCILKLWRTQGKKFAKYNLDFKYYDKFEPVAGELSLRSIEHSLCEYSKYFLQCRNEGKVRMIYNQATAVHNCTVSPETGDYLIETNKEVYDKFYESSASLCEGKYNLKSFVSKFGVSMDSEVLKDLMLKMRKFVE